MALAFRQEQMNLAIQAGFYGIIGFVCHTNPASSNTERLPHDGPPPNLQLAQGSHPNTCRLR